jgi:hypothetical protein
LDSNYITCQFSGGKAIKLAFKAYFDEVETTNPLGYARNVHSIGCLYVSLINLQPDTRNRLEYTFPVTLVLNSVFKRYGALNIVGGAAVDDGALIPIPRADYSLGSQMRLLDAGVAMQATTAQVSSTATRSGRSMAGSSCSARTLWQRPSICP